MLDRIKALWLGEPVLVAGALASVVVFLATKLGIVVDEQSVGAALLYVVPIIIGSAGARAKVSPHVGAIGPDNDTLLAQHEASSADES